MRAAIALASLACLLPSPRCLAAQATYPQSATPLAGKYPGGHVGLRGGSTPSVGVNVFEFVKVEPLGELHNSQGEPISSNLGTSIGLISGVNWNSRVKILGMSWGGLLVVPFNEHYNRPNGGDPVPGGLGFGDPLIAPFILYGIAKHIDYQMAVSWWPRAGSFTPGGDDNHSSGFGELIYTLGGTYYAHGNRRSYSVSAVGRYEQTFDQEDTGINPGNALTVDVGFASPMLSLDKRHQHLLFAGVSGFGTTQLTLESGANASESVSPYRLFALGPEINYMYPKWRLKAIVRAQWQFAARNTTQGATYWFSLAYHFSEKHPVDHH